MNKNKIIVLSAHASAGKDTILPLLCKTLGYKMIVSHTTRPMRLGEVEGVNYHYISDDKFKEMLKNNEFIEYREYHTLVNGKPDIWFYGASKKSVDLSKDGFCVILDPVGLREFKEVYGDKVVSFFIDSPEPLRKERARWRGGFDETEWERRWKDDQKIFTQEFIENEIDFCILNDDGKRPLELVWDIVHCLSNSKEYIMVESNTSLVHAVIKKSKFYNLDMYDDVFQVGVMGLMKAVKSFDKDLGVKFSTYAYTCIKNEIISFYIRSKRKNDLIESAMSLDANLPNSENLTYNDVIPDKKCNVEKDVSKKMIEEFIRSIVEDIPDEVSRKLVKQHYLEGVSYRTLGKLNGVSHEIIRRRVLKIVKDCQGVKDLKDLLTIR